MQNMAVANLLIAGIIFGLSNGLTPGPTLALVISQTLQYNLKAGIKIASAPIIFGLVIIPISIFFSGSVNHLKSVMGVIIIFGSIYIGYMGIKQLFLKKNKLHTTNTISKPFTMGVIANFTSPYAYLFWFTVGSPLIISTQTANVSITLLAAFFSGVYYFCLIGSKILVAIMTEKSRSFMENQYYNIIKILGMLLILFACFALKDGMLLLK